MQIGYDLAALEVDLEDHFVHGRALLRVDLPDTVFSEEATTSSLINQFSSVVPQTNLSDDLYRAVQWEYSCLSLVTSSLRGLLVPCDFNSGDCFLLQARFC